MSTDAMNRTQRRAAMRAQKKAEAKQPASKPVKIDYGVSSTDHLVLQFSIPTSSIWLTADQAAGMAEKIIDTLKILEKRIQERKAANGG